MGDLFQSETVELQYQRRQQVSFSMFVPTYLQSGDALSINAICNILHKTFANYVVLSEHPIHQFSIRLFQKIVDVEKIKYSRNIFK
jgi:hypothetical protein